MEAWCDVFTKLKKMEQMLWWKSEERDILPLYGPDSVMPSVVETQDSDWFCNPGTLG